MESVYKMTPETIPVRYSVSGNRYKDKYKLVGYRKDGTLVVRFCKTKREVEDHKKVLKLLEYKHIQSGLNLERAF